MGQQQLLIIILGIIIVGIALAVGISLFSASAIQANKDAIINDLNNLAANAYQYSVRPSSMGGGNGMYNRYKIPTLLRSNENASYSCTFSSDFDNVIFRATSIHGYGTISATVGLDGKIIASKWVYTGDFR